MLIFVSSVGRSGTKYLSELFSHISEIRGYHAPTPQCLGKVLLDFNNYESPSELFLKRKAIKNSVENGKYFESSQLFLRCFVKEALKLGKEIRLPISVIHLTRDPLQVARSYTNRESFPGRPDCPWRLPMNVQYNYLRIDEHQLTPYQRNLWDWFENEIRYHHYKNKFNKVYDMHFSDLNNSLKLKEMFDFFEVSINENKLKNSLSEKALSRNSNKIKTTVSQQDIKEGEQFIEILKRKWGPWGWYANNVFNDSYYNKYKIFDKLKEDNEKAH